MGFQKKRKRGLWISIAAVIILGGGISFYLYGSTPDEEKKEESYVTAEVGTIVEKALAVGTIEPENEIEVKSKISGVVSRIYAEAGDYVRKGDPLIEVSPDPTPLELAEAKRNLERTEIEEANLARELERMKTLNSRDMISDRAFEEVQQQHNDVKVRLQINRERLELLESGRIVVGDMVIESIIRSPVDGFILEEMVDTGEPVVPLTSYQEGTPLMTLAGMDHLLFKGTVDEIDVGKIAEGMPVEIKIGALPADTVHGEVSRISLKAVEDDNATVFPVEITITDTGGATLRAGYSANADIIIKRMEEIITIPERVVSMREGDAFIDVPGDEPGSRIEKEIELGLSDAITVEVREGLEEGDKVLERPEKTLTVR